MTSYVLNKHVCACIVDRHCVFLDLLNDRYSCIEPDKIAALESILGADSNDSFHRGQAELTNQLLDQGLIVKNSSLKTTWPPTLPAVHKPEKDLQGFELGSKPNIRIIHVLKFLIAAILTSVRMRRQPLSRVIQRVRRIREKQKSHCHKATFSDEHLKGLIEIFNRLRPLLFTAQNQCLYDALALTEFLNMHRIYPNIVFGVKMGPFSAHCWVQHKELVLNDSVAYTLLETPIMVV